MSTETLTPATTSATPSSPKARPLLLTLAVLFAAVTALYSAGWIYYNIRPPAPVEVGIDTDPTPAGLRVRDVWRDSPAQQAGLRPDDLIVGINGQSTASPNSCLMVLNDIWESSHPGETVRLTIRRPGEPAPLTLSPVFRRPVDTGDMSLAQRSARRVLLLYPLPFLFVGMAVLFLRVEDRNAWALALMFAGFIAVSPAPDFSLAHGQLVRQFLFGYDLVVKSLFPAFFYFFFAVFPSRSPIDRKLPWLKWAFPVVLVPLKFGNIPQGRMEPLPFVLHLLGQPSINVLNLVVSYGALLLGIISLLLNAAQAAQVEERRKLKVMLWGTLVGVIPPVLIALNYDLRKVDKPFWMVFTQAVLLSLLPLSFAYAVVKHRVMDVPVLLRRSARYLLVERGFAILIFVVSIAITLWFGEAFSKRFMAGPKAAIPIGATLGVLLFSGATQVHRQVRTRLDRAFFRSAYDAQQILQNLAATTLAVHDRKSLAMLLHEQIRDALHPMPLVIYLLSAERQLRSYAGHLPEEEMTLSAGEPVLQKVARAGAPLELDPDSLRGTGLEPVRPECLVPIGGPADGELQGLIALGPRLSEEPYSARDKRLLASVASQAGIAMRSISIAEAMAQRMDAERRSQQEMQIARQVQSRLLPQDAPKLPTLECAGKCIQTRAVGGDYYDFLDFGSGKLGLVLADISGKGISSALLMANLQASLRGQYALALEDLPRLLRSVNYLFYKNTESNNYATMFFSMYDDESRTLRYVNCGHNPPFLLRAGGSVDQLDSTATVLGLFEEWDCTVAEKKLAADDVLLIYTDGISEAAPGEDAEEFGEDRLIAEMKAHRCKGANEILDGIVAEVQRFSQGEQADDMTLIVARCR